jgi:hypothetical protein
VTNGALLVQFVAVLATLHGAFSFMCWRWMRDARRRADRCYDRLGEHIQSVSRITEDLQGAIERADRLQYENNSFIRVVDRRVLHLENPLRSDPAPQVSEPMTRHEREVIP